MSSSEPTRKRGREENDELIDYKLEYQKLKERFIQQMQRLERARMRFNAELKPDECPLRVPSTCSDVNLLVEGKKMVAKEIVLSTHSPVLAALLKQQSKDGVLVITGTSVDTFEMLLNFLYTGKVPLLERHAATQLMAAAKEYQLEGLKKCLIGQLVTALPDLCLAALFRQMTLQDQIGARKVCRRWADLMLEATSKRRELILLIGDNNIKQFEIHIDWALFFGRQSLKLLLKADGTAMYPTRRLTAWNSLQVKLLDQATAEQIASTFIGTAKLQVTVLNTTKSSVDKLAHLLQLWSGQLISLQFFEGYPKHIVKSTAHLFTAINSLSALKQLHLDLFLMSVPDLSIVSQLEELRLNSYETTHEQFAQWLQQYGEDNQNLARIEYKTGYYLYLELLTALSEPLRQCFTHIVFSSININIELAPICAQFRSLTSLAFSAFSLSSSHITVRQLFSHLTTLHQLIHLRLAIDSDSLSTDDLEHYLLLLLPQVKSVKALELTLTHSMPAHRKLADMQINWTLPNVEVILFAFSYFHCTECNIDHFGEPTSVQSSKCSDCLCQLFTPLKRDCTKLRLIEKACTQWPPNALPISYPPPPRSCFPNNPQFQ